MSHAAQAYARTSQTTASPREIEAQALLKAARQLQDVATNWAGPDKNMHQALLFNRRLWSIFMSAAETNANKKSFTITVSDVSGFHAKVKYQSDGTVKFQDVLIKDLSFRVGDTKFTLTNKLGTAQIKNVVTDPATGSPFLDTATATRS